MEPPPEHVYKLSWGSGQDPSIWISSHLIILASVNSSPYTGFFPPPIFSFPAVEGFFLQTIEWNWTIFPENKWRYAHPERLLGDASFTRSLYHSEKGKQFGSHPYYRSSFQWSYRTLWRESLDILGVASQLCLQQALLTKQFQLPSGHFDCLVEDSTLGIFSLWKMPISFTMVGQILHQTSGCSAQ